MGPGGPVFMVGGVPQQLQMPGQQQFMAPQQPSAPAPKPQVPQLSEDKLQEKGQSQEQSSSCASA